MPLFQIARCEVVPWKLKFKSGTCITTTTKANCQGLNYNYLGVGGDTGVKKPTGLPEIKKVKHIQKQQ